MRRLILVALVALSLAIPAIPAGASVSHADARHATVGAATAAPRAEAFQFALSQRTRDAINKLIRAALPLVCPLMARMAATDYRAYIEATCKAMGSAPDPLQMITEFLPLACGGNPPLISLVYPQFAKLFTAVCPIMVKLPSMLHLT